MNVEYIIDGGKFSSKNGFFNYIEENFTQGLDFKIGRNLNAFQDVLCGGFGMHAYDEHIVIIWKNLAKSRERLDPDFLNAVLEILETTAEVTFQTYEHGIR